MQFTRLFGLAVITVIYISYFPAIDGQRSLYTQKEIQAIQKFRPMVFKHLTEDFMKRDAYLLRFIRSYDFDFDKAARRLEFSANWRKEKKMDRILQENHRAHVREVFARFGGVDKKGYPIVYFPTGGKWDMRKYILNGKRDYFLRAFQQSMEKSFQRIWEVADATGKDLDQYHLVVDLDGYNARQNLCLGCIPLTMEMAASFDAVAPVFARKIVIVNTPRAFTPILKLLRSTFPYPPISLLRPFDSNADVWKKELLKDISPDQLLKEFGGTREG